MTKKNIDSKEFLSQIVIYSKYSKYNKDLGRRETWEELVDRNAEMHINKYPHLKDEIKEVYNRSVLTKKVVPSMRSFQFAGKAIEVNNSRMFNCASRKLDSATAFAEVMFLLLGGSGVGISVQKQHIEQIPAIHTPGSRTKKYVVSDDIQGWADCIKHLVKSYTGGKTNYRFDYSEIRQKGTRLVTAGGKAPGPEPLRECVSKITTIFERAIESRGEGTKLKPIEAHDIACHIANAVLAGGIRRCLTDDYVILMDDDTYKEISQIQSGDRIKYAGDSYEVSRVFDNGDQDVYRIETDEGFHESSTLHRWLVKCKTTGEIKWLSTSDISKNPENYYLVREKHN